MSYYINYYLGYRDTDGKIYPLGPYDHKGELNMVTYRSRHSEIQDQLKTLPEDMISEELKEDFSYEDYNGEKEFRTLKYLPLNELQGSSNFIKSGYFLIEDIQRYLDDDVEYFDGFYDSMTSTTYAMKLAAETSRGTPPVPKTDVEGGEYTEHSVFDYAFFAYPDYNSKEYEIHEIRNMADVLRWSLKDGQDIVILETEG